jgi:hypothetical protein
VLAPENTAATPTCGTSAGCGTGNRDHRNTPDHNTAAPTEATPVNAPAPVPMRGNIWGRKPENEGLGGVGRTRSSRSVSGKNEGSGRPR